MLILSRVLTEWNPTQSFFKGFLGLRTCISYSVRTCTEVVSPPSVIKMDNSGLLWVVLRRGAQCGNIALHLVGWSWSPLRYHPRRKKWKLIASPRPRYLIECVPMQTSPQLTAGNCFGGWWSFLLTVARCPATMAIPMARGAGTLASGLLGSQTPKTTRTRRKPRKNSMPTPWSSVILELREVLPRPPWFSSGVSTCQPNRGLEEYLSMDKGIGKRVEGNQE